MIRTILSRSLAFGLACASVPCAASTLRAVTTLAEPVVHVADLFDDAGPDGARVLGPAPAPGARLVIESAQLAAIARQFGVAWRPISSADRVVLERPGRVLARAGVLDALRAALEAVGAAPGAEIELPGFVAPMIAQDSHPDLGVEQVDYDGDTGRFTGVVLLTGTDVETQRLRVSGRVNEMIEVPVPVRRIQPNVTIMPEDLRTVRLRATALHGEVVRQVDQAVGRALRHPAFPGQPIALADVTRPSDIHKGDRVGIELNSPGLSLTAVGLAMENGATGDRISVLNPASHAVVEAEVLGAGRVRVTPGSMPSASASSLASNLATVMAER